MAFPLISDFLGRVYVFNPFVFAFVEVHRCYLEKQGSGPFCFHCFALRKVHTHSQN